MREILRLQWILDWQLVGILFRVSSDLRNTAGEQRLQPAPKRAWGTPWFMIMANALRAKKSNPKPLYCIVHIYILYFYIII